MTEESRKGHGDSQESNDVKEDENEATSTRLIDRFARNSRSRGGQRDFIEEWSHRNLLDGRKDHSKIELYDDIFSQGRTSEGRIEGPKSRMSQDSILENEVVTDEDIESIVYDETTLLETEPEITSESLIPIGESDVRASRREDDQSLNNSKDRNEMMAEAQKQEDVKEAVNAFMKSIDDRIESSNSKSSKKLKEAKKKLEEAVDQYKAGESSEAEAKFLRNIIRYQYAAQQVLTETIDEELEDQSKLIDEVVATSEELAKKNEELTQKLKEMRAGEQEKDHPACFFCESTKHSAVVCYQFRDYEERTNMLIAEDKCLLCFQKGHKKTECADLARYESCKKCKQEKHHVSICPKYATKERTEMKQARGPSQKKEDEQGDMSGRHKEEWKELDGPKQSSSEAKKQRQPILPP
ncbi:hypothetical protein CRE_26052 [Caenorhabditis remanei]|uniref:CCHC-type domain-containing protein n=1 Tax=Caenorhabditis remanei TaxID=31234 RepID=E3LRF8_CAERE|nr:hypothetical protein CRE_26052 [Caenorhabditis remanei]